MTTTALTQSSNWDMILSAQHFSASSDKQQELNAISHTPALHGDLTPSPSFIICWWALFNSFSLIFNEGKAFIQSHTPLQEFNSHALLGKLLTVGGNSPLLRQKHTSFNRDAKYTKIREALLIPLKALGITLTTKSYTWVYSCYTEDAISSGEKKTGWWF